MTIKSEKEKMIAGELYFANDPELEQIANLQEAKAKSSIKLKQQNYARNS